MAEKKRFKTFTATVKVLASERKLTFTISTAAVDRDKDTLDPKGWVLDGYRDNPVVLWAHDSKSLPIARASEVRITPDGLEAVAEFPTAEDYPFADQVYRLAKAGFINATSVGFIPHEGQFNKSRGGYDWTSQELIEFSLVPVPSNPEALIQARAAGLGDAVDALTDWASAIVKDMKAGRVLSAANRARVQQMRDASAQCMGMCDEMLAMDSEDEMKAAPAPVPAAPLPLRGRFYRITPAAIVDAVKSALPDAVRAGIRLALGRLD